MSIADTFQPILESPIAVRQMPHHLKQTLFRSMAKGTDHRSADRVFMLDGRNDSTARKAPASVDDFAHMLLPVFAVRRSLRASPRRRFAAASLRGQLREISAHFLARAPTDNCGISQCSRHAFAAWSPLCDAAIVSRRIAYFLLARKKRPHLFPPSGAPERSFGWLSRPAKQRLHDLCKQEKEASTCEAGPRRSGTRTKPVAASRDGHRAFR